MSSLANWFRHHLAVTIVLSLMLGGAGVYAITRLATGRPMLPVTADYSFSGKDKTRYVADYAKAPKSLQQTLMDGYYLEAEKECVAENRAVSTDGKIEHVMTISKLVRNDFALVQFCGSGGGSIFARTSIGWELVADVADYPNCATVDQYKVSKQIVDRCYDERSEQNIEVRYD